MNKIVQQAGLENDNSVIAAATDVKAKSFNRGLNIVAGCSFAAGIGTILFLLYLGVTNILESVDGWLGIVLTALFIAVVLPLLALVIMIVYVVFVRVIHGSWYFILYPDHFLYKYRKENKEWSEKKVAIQHIKKCIIQNRMTATAPLRWKSRNAHIHIFIQYGTPAGQVDTIALRYTDTLTDLNKAMGYLTGKGIPFYFFEYDLTDVYNNVPEDYDLNFLDEAEPINFKGRAGELESFRALFPSDKAINPLYHKPKSCLSKD